MTHDPTSLDARATSLHARRDALAARVSAVDQELVSHHDPDWADLATEREADEVLEGIGRSARQETRMITAALARIAAGQYGICTGCGETISAARLDILPDTPWCQTCAGAPRKAAP